jgi:hypothetical protein
VPPLFAQRCRVVVCVACQLRTYPHLSAFITSEIVEERHSDCVSYSSPLVSTVWHLTGAADSVVRMTLGDSADATRRLQHELPALLTKVGLFWVSLRASSCLVSVPVRARVVVRCGDVTWATTLRHPVVLR